MRRSLLLVLCTLLGVFGLQAEKKFTVINDYALGKSISPNGRYIVGVDPTQKDFGVNGMTGFRSFLWDVQESSISWLTEGDSEDFSKTGSFTDVTDDRVISGFFKDEDYKITVVEWEGSYTLPINVAAIWKDGKVTSLGIGDFKLSQFTNFEDGSFAMALSNDAKTVVGYIALANFAFSFPCQWKYDEDTEKWDFTRLSLPDEAKGGQAIAVSDDGNVVVGTVWFKRKEVAAVWKNGECTLIEGRNEDGSDDTIYNTNSNLGAAYGISSNGEYVIFRFNKTVPGIYMVKEDKYIKLPEYADVTGLEFSAVANNGDIFGAYKYGNAWTQRYTRPVFRSHQSSQIVDFEYFLKLCASDIDIPLSFNFEQKVNATPIAVSADGKTLLGNNEYKVWVLQAEDSQIAVPEVVDNIHAKISDLKEVMVDWNKKNVTAEYTPLSYNIYCDGEMIGNIAADQSQVAYLHQEVKPGIRLYSVSCVYKNNISGMEIESPRADPVSVCMPSTFEIPMFDNFDSQSVLTNYWTVTAQRNNQWKINFGAPAYQGIGWTPGMMTSVDFDHIPYSAAVESRFLDAREQDKVYVSFLKRFLFLNGRGLELEGDTLSVEVAKFGEGWISIKDYLLKKSEESYWIYEYLDISKQVAGSLFQLRFRVHGKGLAMYSYQFDLFKVGGELEYEAPSGLIGEKKDGKLNLAWKNNNNAYEVGYSVSNYELDVVRQALGDEGKIFIAANSFESGDLSLYNDKYLTSVSAFINHDPNVENSKDTQAAIVVFENGKLIREQNIDDIEINVYNTVILNEPVKIDASKDLKIGLKIYDYDERQIPVAYQITDLFKAGKSDLYSQDGGTTWKKLSDYYSTIEGKEQNGRCCWEIIGNITDEITAEVGEIEDDQPVAYTLYRNGERINYLSLYLPARYTIDDPMQDNDYYEVRAYYEDGRTSELSEKYSPSLTSLDAVDKESGISIYMDPVSDRIYLNGEFVKATLYGIDGQILIATTEKNINVAHLSGGIYVLKIENGSSVENHKILIRR